MRFNMVQTIQTLHPYKVYGMFTCKKNERGILGAIYNATEVIEDKDNALCFPLYDFIRGRT